MKIDFQNTMNAIITMEKTCAVNEITFGSLRVWPIVRIVLWMYTIHGNPDALAYKRQNLHEYEYQLDEATLKAVESFLATSTDLLLFCTSLCYTDRRDGLFYNKFVDPFIDLFSDSLAVRKLDIAEPSTEATQPRYHPSLLLRYATHATSLVEDECGRVQNFEPLRQAVQTHFGMDLDERLLIDYARSIQAYRVLFRTALERIRPKAVGVVCYYYPQGMALAWACRDLSIPCAELQHGKQGKCHGMYTHWTEVPEDGYELLPSHFWMWGEESQDNVVAWMPEGRKFPRFALGGSPWLGMWAEGRGFDSQPGARDRLKTLLAGRQAVLFTMQPIRDPLPSALLEAMRQTPPHWVWLVRLHPQQVGRVAQWEAFFAENGVSNVEVELPSAMDLLMLLEMSRHHVTCYSSVVYEALALGLSTTLVHAEGASLFGGYVEKGHFRHAREPQDILASVALGLGEVPRREARPYILRDTRRMEALIRSLCAGGTESGGWVLK